MQSVWSVNTECLLEMMCMVNQQLMKQLGILIWRFVIILVLLEAETWRKIIKSKCAFKIIFF